MNKKFFLMFFFLFTYSLNSFKSTTLMFWQGILRNPQQVGAIAPCSDQVAKEISKHIKNHQPNASSDSILRVVEVGGGCGALSKEIEKQLIETGISYTFDIIEIDASYCTHLTSLFADNTFVRVHCADICTWKPGYKYDIVISSLPFTSLPSCVVEQALKQFTEFTQPGGTISYIEYIFLSQIKKIFLSGDSKKEFEHKRSLLNEFKNKFCIETKKIWFNIMPTYVYHLKVI